MCVYLLAGKLAEHRRDVAGILSHLFLNGLLHCMGDSAGHTGHDVLQLQQGQGGVPQSLHQPLNPLLQLREYTRHHITVKGKPRNSTVSVVLCVNIS